MTDTGHRGDALTEQLITDFMQSHRLPPAFRGLIADHYLPLVSWLVDRRSSGKTMILGINGAQGTGKSTLADFLQLALELQYQWRVAVLSIDDFYLTKSERRDLAEQVHPLLAIRGVPGTHDVGMLSQYLDDLRHLAAGERYRLPRFDKAQDDRAPVAAWPQVTGPIDLIILEGWCVGSVAQDDAELATSINDLERDNDPRCEWRKYANDRLKSDYAQLFSALDALVFLQAPSFEAIYNWRLEQEQKLAASVPAGAPGIMNSAQIAEFMQSFERISRSNLALFPKDADVVFVLGEDHGVLASQYRSGIRCS